MPRGKRLCVLTNAASYPRLAALEKYRRLGFDFTAEEVVFSRDIAAARLESIPPGAIWGAIAAEGDSFADLPAKVVDVMESPGALDRTDAILFRSAARWTQSWQESLSVSMERSMERKPRPLVVANPDLVAPREGGLSREFGFYTHALVDRMDLDARFFGKPFAEAILDTETAIGLDRGRLARVGDTLHTDILGGAAQGMGTVLVTQHGLFAGHKAEPFLDLSGIIPDVVVGTT